MAAVLGGNYYDVYVPAVIVLSFIVPNKHYVWYDLITWDTVLAYLRGGTKKKQENLNRIVQRCTFG